MQVPVSSEGSSPNSEQNFDVLYKPATRLCISAGAATVICQQFIEATVTAGTLKG